MEYFKKHPETGVTHPSQIAVVGDRLMTDMMLANMMGGWGFWVKDGVIPLAKKSLVCSCLPLVVSRRLVASSSSLTRAYSSLGWITVSLHYC